MTENDKGAVSFSDLLIIPSLVLACRNALGPQVKLLHLVSKELKRVFVSTAKHLCVDIGTLVGQTQLEKLCRLLENTQLERLWIKYGDGGNLEDVEAGGSSLE